MQVLDNWNIGFEPGVIRDKTIATWYRRKRDLLELFSKHPNWSDDAVGVVFKTRYSRPIDARRAGDYARDLIEVCFGASDRDSSAIRRLYCDVANTYLCGSFVLDDNSLELWRNLCPADKTPGRFFPKGLRTSRAFDRLFRYYGLDKSPHYNALFAKLADAVSPLSIDRTAVLSFHPCDYLLMSHGTGWRSCHRINGGEWQGGTWSYMLDPVSSILFTTEETTGPLWNREKVNRMVTCFQDQAILFSRIYPDYCDSELRKTFRQVVQDIYSSCLGIPNLWEKPMHTTEYQRAGLVQSADGYMQYPDYDYSEYGAELSLPKGYGMESVMEIGAPGICPVTGDEYGWGSDDHFRLDIVNGHRCAYCGCIIEHTWDAFEWDGGCYCSDCRDNLFAECACCGEWTRRRHMTDTTDGLVCDDCLRENYIECDYCGRYEHEDRATCDAHNAWYCERCAEYHLTYCDNCDEYYPDEEMEEHDGHCYCRDCVRDLALVENLNEEVQVNA